MLPRHPAGLQVPDFSLTENMEKLAAEQGKADW
jgi:hypothetical protein